MQINFLRLALLAVLSAAVLALAACGGSDSSDESADAGPDPATMAPADAPFYGELVVRPEGTLGDDLDSALSKLLGTEDPGAMLRDAFDAELASDPDNGDLNYADDIEPWLGSRAGVFFSGIDLDAEEAQGALVVAVTDADAAQAFVNKVTEADSSSETDESYEGVDYKLSDDDTAVGIDGDFLVVGNEQGLQDAVDAGAGDSLVNNSDAVAALDDAPDGSVFSAYFDGTAIEDLLKSSGELSAAQLRQLDTQLARVTQGPLEAWGTVTDSTFALGASAPTQEGAGEPSDLISTFPADSWLAFATGGVGAQLQDAIGQFETGFDAGFKRAAPRGFDPSKYNPLTQIEAQTGLDLEKDLGWIGDIGGFVHGTSIFGLGAGVVVNATDENAASASLGKIESALQGVREIQVTSSGDGFKVQSPGSPIGAEVALQDGKVVTAIGADSVDDVVAPTETLDGSDRFGVVTSALGEGATPNFFVDFGPIVDLVEGSGQAASDPDYQMAKPYIDALDFLVSGSSVDGDRTIGSIVLGVKEAAASTTDATAAVIAP